MENKEPPVPDPPPPGVQTPGVGENSKQINLNLNAIVFGEAVLNDAVSIILAQ